MLIIYHEHLGDIIIAGKKDLDGNIILESRDLVLSYLHIDLHTGDEKYKI